MDRSGTNTLSRTGSADACQKDRILGFFRFVFVFEAKQLSGRPVSPQESLALESDAGTVAGESAASLGEAVLCRGHACKSLRARRQFSRPKDFGVSARRRRREARPKKGVPGAQLQGRRPRPVEWSSFLQDAAVALGDGLGRGAGARPLAARGGPAAGAVHRREATGDRRPCERQKGRENRAAACSGMASQPQYQCLRS